MNYQDYLHLYFERSSALQSYWTLYVAVIVAALGFSSQRKQRDFLTTATVTVLFSVFAYQNLSAILDTTAQRFAVVGILDRLGPSPELAALAGTLRPPTAGSTLAFHLVGDVLAIAALWVMERRRNIYANAQNS